MARKPDLIVPIRDRRRRKRYLTLKNFAWATGIAFALFVVISIRSEMRGTGPGYYGRLYERELPQVEQKPVEVVREAALPVSEATHADPMLTESYAREQWLHDTNTAEALPTTTVSIQPRATGSESHVAIVGGTDGVAIVQQTRRRPVLSGGFGR
jgi:hypothetical protein